MRAVVQRVAGASVTVDGEVVAKIGPGLLCLVGVKQTDSEKDADYICGRILGCRAWPNSEEAPWKEDVRQRELEVLVVSQFTLLARLKRNKPDFSKAMAPGQAREMYDTFVEQMRGKYVDERVKSGIFGAMMQVSLQNDGPVTFILDSETD